MTQGNGTSPRALAAEKLRELPLKPAESAAVTRLETSSMYYTDQALIESLADEMTSSANRRKVEKALRSSWYHPEPETRKDDPALLQRIASAAAVVEAQRLAANAALDAVILAQLALRKANESQVERRRAELQTAGGERQAAHEAHERALVALNALYAERDARRRYAALAESTK